MRALSHVTTDPKRGTDAPARAFERSPRNATAAPAPSVVTPPASFGLHRIRIQTPPADRATLRIGEADHPYEREADRLADEALRPSPRRRAAGTCPCGGRVEGGGECAACRQKRLSRLRRSALPAAVVSGTSATVDTSAPAIVHDVLDAPGRPLDPVTRAFMEPRFGCDFGHVRVHTDARAAASAYAVGARAYTVAQHVVFGAGEFDSGSTTGRRLIAHELAHVRQHTDTPSPHDQPALRRKLKVANPTAKIPNPDGKGKVLTNAQQTVSYLNRLCDSPFASIQVTSGGAVGSSMCDDPTLIPAVVDRTVHGCMCLCDVVNSKKTVTIFIDDKSTPHESGDEEKSTTPGLGGADSEVHIPSENAPKNYGAPTVSGKFVEVEPFVILGHEMCGHALLATRGLETPGPKSGRPAHVATINRENLIRTEHGIEVRGVWKDPYCGEAFSYPKGKATPTTFDEIRKDDPEFGDACTAFRATLNWFACTNFRIEDRIPDVVPDQCPPGTGRA